MPLNLISSLVILVFIFANFEVVICPRKPVGWASYGKGRRNEATLDAHYAKSEHKMPRPYLSRKPIGFTFADDTAVVDQIASGFARLNVLGNMATHISKEDYAKIRDYIWKVVHDDLCACDVGGLMSGNVICLEAFTQFKRVPKNMRGANCREASLSRCYKPEGSEDLPLCSFFIKTSPGHDKPVTGHWLPLIVCAQDLERPPVTGTPGANWL